MKYALTVAVVAAFAAAVAFTACGRAVDVVLGRVEMKVGGHPIIVTDCYRTSVPAPEALPASADGPAGHRFAPCRDAVIVIRGTDLTVNGKAYGSIQPTDAILVDHGVVSVNDTPRRVLR